MRSLVTSELFRMLKETNTPLVQSRLGPQALAELLDLVQHNVINANTGKGVLSEMFHTGKTAAGIIAEKGLAQVRDVDLIADLVAKVLATHSDAVAQYLGGKEAILGFLIGQVMKASHGKADPQLVRDRLLDRLTSLRAGSAP